MSMSNKKVEMEFKKNLTTDLFDIDYNKVQNDYQDLRSAKVESNVDTSSKVDKSLSVDKSFTESSFKLIESYFKGQHLERLVRHQLESYNNFVNYQIMKTIEMFNPLRIVSENDFDPLHKKHALEIIITFENFQLYRPQIHENNGAIKLMFPNEARLRNFTYASSMTVDMNIKYLIRSGKELENSQILHKIIPKIHIGKLPIMLKSSICVLNQYKHVDHLHTGECKMDTGGYFIINGSEKTVLGQERAAENKIYVFNVSKNNTKFDWLAEVKSIPDDKCISPKQINMMISSKNNGFGFPIYLQIPRVKQPVPLFIVFRALGVLTDKEICEKILLDIGAEGEKELLQALHASIIDANKHLTQEECIRYITSFAMYTPINMDKETGIRKKFEFTLDILNNDLFPHCRTKVQKIYYLGYMTKKIVMTSFDKCKQDDRDSYLNKRVDLTGALLNNLFRNYFNKLVKDMEKQVIREINTGSWRSKDDYENIINMTNIYKIVKSTTIENGLKRALATGDFGLKHTNSNKVGVAQVLNRLTYVSSLSHLRRISTPIDKSGKLIPPRKLHNSSWAMTCPAETPEGQSVGVVKNMSYMAHITIYSNPSFLYEFILPQIIALESDLEKEKPDFFYNKVKVFINGTWIGVSENPEELYNSLKDKKSKGILNIYVGILFDYRMKEIRVCNDAGRLMRPLLRVKDQSILFTDEMADRLESGDLKWNDLLIGTNLSKDIDEAVLEYIDAEEQGWSMISMNPKQLNQQANNDGQVYKYTHCEIHPSTIFGILASCIPFPEHNQSPRVVYQCAQGKQAMGIYATNYDERMDKTAYILNYPTRPLVDTRIMDMIHINQIPAGTNVIVAIMTHTGYNQEDSLLFNKGSVDRGLFVTTIYHTEKDEDKQKINGDEEIRCKPDRVKTKGMKMGNYDKVNSQGVIPENTLVENRDVIIAKIVPIKENKNDHTKVIKYEDQSKIYRTAEETFVDKNYIGKNGEGYNFAKVRLRIVRKPNIGDKFCALPTQQVLTDQGWVEIKDIDIHHHKLATLDTNGKMCYEYPSAKYEYDHNDKMYYLKNKQIHIVCTLNHRLYVKKRSGKNYELIEAKDVMGKMVRFQKTMENVYPDIQTITLGDTSYPMDDWLQLLGMFIADGWCDKTNKRIFITAIKERKIEFVKNILINLNIEYSYHKNGNYSISGWKYPEIGNELTKLSVGALYKHLPDYVWNLSQRQSILLLEALLQGDGHTMTYKGEDEFSRYGTISLQLANDISRLSLHCGYSGIIKIAEEPSGIARTGKRNLGSREGQEVSVTQRHTYYKVSIIRKQNQPWINKKQNESNEEKLIDYEGKIYCVEMPSSHTYYMRENDFSPSLIIGNSSRHGQKGTIGNIIPECDMPFTSSGVRPDIIINPHAIPSRMTIGQLKETSLGKVLVHLGLFGDGTSFGELEVADICKELLKVGYEAYGNELLHNGLTGEQHECSVFMGPVFYQRLKHMVNDKTHSRSIGPMVNLTRQPAEGRSRDGGLRYGEMERDCVEKNTKIDTYCGLAIKIKNLADFSSNIRNQLLGWSKEKNGIVKAQQSGFLYKGERDCLDVILQDGRKITCTPDHPLLTSNNEWVKAKDLIPGESKVKAGVNYPVMDIEEEMKECKGWALKVGTLLLTTNTPDEYFKTLAFMRILGYLITDGSIHYHPELSNKQLRGGIFLGHMLDVESVLNDLKLFCPIQQTNFKSRNLYYVRIPNLFLKNIVQLKGILYNKKVNQKASLPEFLLEDSCPRPMIREFLGGLFGGDGHTCSLGLHRGKRDTITSISFSQTKNYQQLDSLKEMMEQIKSLLARCDIHKVSIQNPKETTLSKAKQYLEIEKNNYQVNLHLDLSELIPFSEKIGFRYCCHKSQRLEAGVSYRRLRNEVARQHNWLVNRVDELTNFKESKKEFPEKKVGTKKAVLQAVEELKEKEGLLHEYAIPSTHDITDHLVKGTEFGKFTASGFPTAEEFFREIGALEWFFQEDINISEKVLDDEILEEEEEDINSINARVEYGVHRETEAIPTMNLTVVSRIPVGPQSVYDIQVDDVHSFLANGIVAHNCMISHGASRFNKERLYDVSDKYSVHVCKKCGLIASYNDQMNIHLCRNCDNRTDFAYVEIPYACKLLFQELTTMNISPRIIT